MTLRYIASLPILGLLIGVSCSTPEIRAGYRAELFSTATMGMRARKGEGTFPKVIPADMTEPIVLRLGLADCFELAQLHNRTILLQELSVEMAKSSVTAAEASTDLTMTAGLTLSRSEAELETKYAGDTRDRDETTTQSANLGISAPFNTGTTASLSHSLSRVTTNSPFSTFDWSSNLALSVTQKLLDGFGFVGTRTTLDVARGELAATRLDAAGSAGDVRYSVAQAYWDLVLAREDRAVLYRQRETSRVAVERATERFKEGLDTRIDVLSAESSLEAQEQSIIAAELKVEQMTDDLLRTIHPDLLYGYSEIKGYRLKIEPLDTLMDDEAEQATPELTGEVRKALQQRVDLKAAVERLRTAGLDVAQRDQALLPDLDFTFSGTVYGNADDVGTVYEKMGRADSRYYSGGLTFSMPLENSYDRSQSDRARAEYMQEVHNARKVEIDVIVEVVDGIRGIDSARKGVVSAKKARDLSLEQYQAAMERKDTGLGTSYEVKQAFADLTSAERDLVKARVSLQLAWMELQRANGSLTVMQ